MTDPKPTSLRKRAETLMSDGKAAPTSTLDGDRLLHELQVHQVELELQNEELANTCMELALLRDRYCDLYDFAPVAYLTLAADGRVLELNLAAAQLLGLDRKASLGRRLAEFVHEDSREPLRQLLSRTLAGSEQIDETLVLQASGAGLVYLKAQARLFDCPSEGACVRIVLMDVSALRTANEELQRSFEKFFRYWRP